MGKIRSRGRELAFQILFQCDQTGDKVNAVVARFQELKSANAEAAKFAEALAVGAYKHQDALDEQIRTCAKNWKLERLLSVDRAVLRLAAHELIATPETPTEVVLDEAIELAKHFGSDESAAFVNGVLDQIATTARGQAKPKATAKPKPRSTAPVGAGSPRPPRVAKAKPKAKSTAIPRRKVSA
jgi:N utilization substance protein B